MMLQCDIVSTEKKIFNGIVKMIVISGILGELGIQYGHAPLLTSLIAGPIRIIKNNLEEEIFFCF